MKLIGKILICLVFVIPTNASAMDARCDNAVYKRAHPDTCTDKSDKKTWIGAGIGAGAVAAAAVAITSIASGGGDTSAPPQPTMAAYSNVGADVDSARLASIMNGADYAVNMNPYNDIRAAYATARGYTGADTTIAVMDTGNRVSHGGYVATIASGAIAPDATVERYAIARSYSNFYSYDKIGDVINSAADANVINNSWNVGMRATDITSHDQFAELTDKHFVNAISDAATRDTIFVWAAGNDGMAQSGAMSAIPNIIPETRGKFINVVAVDSDTLAITDFSNACGITRDWCIAAPGTGINVGDTTVSGTSFAAPIVSAAIAVLRDAFPYMTASQIVSLLFETARDLGPDGVDDIYGHGLVDLERATRPVGTELVPVSATTTVPMRAARIPGQIARPIKSANITFAYIDAYGRAFDTTLNENISVRNHGRGWNALHGENAVTVPVGPIDIGYKDAFFMAGDGFMGTSPTHTSFIATHNTAQFNHIKLIHHMDVGISNPSPDIDSIIDGFSPIYTLGAKISAEANQWHIGIGAPDTIISGHMYMTVPTGRAPDGEYEFARHSVDLSGRPPMEYSVGFKSVTAGFVDNPIGRDEIYIVTKSRFVF